ncbi:MAG TPA: HsdR family type I site-specific deoxyribonuclease [Thermoplasmatales archaeon]|nr:HsdR family type I site-specific deoxyribonuclease [Thermoplasmatales archaeon]
MPLQIEKTAVEDYIVDGLVEQGWRFVPAEELQRIDLEEPLLIGDLTNALRRINEGIGLGEEEIRKVINELKLRGAGIEGVKQILYFLKSGVSIRFEKERVVKNVKLFDFEDVGKNEFIVSRQVSYKGKETIRVDIILYVNGIPLVIIECKNPLDMSVSWYDAYRQIKYYEKNVPELFKYVQVGIAAEQIAKYFPIVRWLDSVKIYEWREDGKDSLNSTIGMLSPDKLLDLIQNFIFIREEKGRATKVIARYMQYRAANKIVGRVLNNFRGKKEPNKGLIWHWQGSGKTLTMIFAANKLYHLPELENPTIFFIVDRRELEEQLRQEFNALDILKSEVIGSISQLKRMIKHDEGRGKRGIFITLVHKFSPLELDELQKELEDLSKTQETIMDRKNIIALIDEGHRSQYGLLASQMRRILRNAFFFAFTGTPLAKKGRDTYEEFSNPPYESYLDKYFIEDSIKDGFTLKIVYQPRLEDEEGIHLDKELLEAFLEQEFEELPEEIRKRVEEKVRKKLNKTRVFLKNPKRIRRIAEDIAKHFQEEVDGKFKAMVVAVDREACILYKRALDKLLPEEYSEVVMTFNMKDPKPIQEYFEELRERYKGKEIEDIRKEIIDKFKEEELPKILIVTDMLLTGFDAPILQTMYLDKPLKEHRLLQAIARTNRPYEDVKEAGLIIDYIGLFKELEKAFEIYSKEDIKGAIYDINEMREEFANLMNKLLAMFEELPGNYETLTLMKAFEILSSDDKKAKEFLRGYRKLRKLFELLGPDTIKAELYQEYRWISGIYVYYIRMVDRRKEEIHDNVKEYFRRTVNYVYATTEIGRLKENLLIIEFDENYIKNLEERVKSKEEKAANIVFTLNKFVLVERHKNPVYERVVDKVERIVKMWKEKNKDFEKIYEEGVKVWKEIQELNARQKEIGLDELEYSLLLALEEKVEKENLIKDVRELMNKIKEHMFPNWFVQQTARKNIGKEIRKFLRRYELGMEKREELYKKLMESVENYGTS